MTAEPARKRTGLDVFAKRIAWAAYAVFGLSALIAVADKSSTSYIANFLGLSFLFSLALLFIAAVVFVVIAENRYTSAAMSSHRGLVVLGGGVVLAAIAIWPILKITDPFFDNLAYRNSPAQVITFFVILLALFSFNVSKLKSLGQDLAVRPIACTAFILPLTAIVTLWIVALGKAMYLYGVKSSDGWLLKSLLELVNGVYLAALVIAGCLVFELFRRDPKRHVPPA